VTDQYFGRDIGRSPDGHRNKRNEMIQISISAYSHILI
jgi:hypothetical protein